MGVRLHPMYIVALEGLHVTVTLLGQFESHIFTMYAWGVVSHLVHPFHRTYSIHFAANYVSLYFQATTP